MHKNFKINYFVIPNGFKIITGIWPNTENKFHFPHTYIIAMISA